jgi:2-polyprenyl-3-methyl-5-hydroxy-6-metoxy-1,4-benzoquinol methylase
MGERPRLHRKQWEFAYIAQALFERGMLVPGKRGLGFGVGQEPLASLFANYGCTIVATDQDVQEAEKAGWKATGQHSNCLASLNGRGICAPAQFDSLVTFRIADMNNIPSDLVEFDFIWSSCALEHLGSIRKGQQFISRSMKCLHPGGVAVHTTEYNVSSNSKTITAGSTVLFRKSDIEQIVNRLGKDGHRVELDFDQGKGEVDQFIDRPPYLAEPHLKLAIGQYVSTSFGLIIQHADYRHQTQWQELLNPLKRLAQW